MNVFLNCIVLAIALSGVSAAADEPVLRQQLVKQNGWVGYKVPMLAGSGSPCCYSEVNAGVAQARCDLDTRKGTFVSDDRAGNASGQLVVYWHVSKGEPDQVKAFAASCAVTSKEGIRWIDPVAVGDSIAALAKWVGDNEGRKGSDTLGLAALALHADALATTALIELASANHPQDLREQAIFWLGHARGIEGAKFVEHVAKTDPNPDLRAHAVFALSQSSQKSAYPSIVAISKSDASEHVRSQALFWMAQMNDPRAQVDITATLNSETSDEVREQAVFALTQLDEKAATSALIAIIRGGYPHPIKEKALFWLGQSGTDQAMAFIDEVLTQ